MKNTVKGGIAALIIVGAMTIGISLAGTAPANADIDDATGDVIFRASLANQGLLFNFPLEKYQGWGSCQSIIDGTKPLDAIYDLMRDGGYSFDVANGMTSSASIA